MQLTVRELSPDEHRLWDALVEVSPQRTIFAQRWWIDVVTHGKARLLGCFTGNRLVAGLPVWPYSTLGVRRLRQPLLTPYWGPLLAPLEGGYSTRLSTELHILRELAEALLPWADITIQYHPSLTNWLPFYWCKFTQTTRYTYRIDDLAAITGNRCHKTVRQKLRYAAQNGLHLQDMVDPLIVARMSQLSMVRQGLGFSREIMTFWPRLAAEAMARKCMFTTAAIDVAGNIHTANAVVWDDRCAYAILGGGDPRFRNSGAGTMTLWHEVEMAANVVPAFDFEGSMIESIASHFRRFGGELYPYMLISRCVSTRMRLARALMLQAQRMRQWLHGTRKPAFTDDEEITAPIPST